MAPFNHDARQVSFLDPLIAHCDLYLAITGNFWFDSLQDSLFAHWAPKMVHVDLAVDRGEFPVIKKLFNPPGARRFLYIGHSGWWKNMPYLKELAARLPGQISWMGTGKGDPEGLSALGHQDFSSSHARSLVATYDFLIMVGKADSNPATILEAMAWGLVPVCTPTSGYTGYPGIVNIPLGDPDEAVRQLRALQSVPDSRLAEMQAVNWRALDTHFNWERFAGQVLDAVRSDERPIIAKESLARKARLRASSLASPSSMFRLAHLRLLTAEREWGS
jgi:glycosyltransferase involved in cell wall biosynthesis